MDKLIEIALAEYGVTEISGPTHNKRIVQYSKDIGHGGIIDDETAWCSIFANWCALKADLERSKKLNARSWLEVGTEVETPQTGDIVIYWRSSPHSWKGHVGIFINKIGSNIYTLGGNQKNSVCIQPYSESQLLGYRRLDPT